MAEKGDRYRFFRAGSREAQRPPGNHPAARCLRRLYANSEDDSADQQHAAVQSQAPDHLG
jgi:hypothetical protein